MEECWLWEAVTDCYLPLLSLLEKVQSKSASIALSLSPTLLEQWAHPDFSRRYQDHLTRLGSILNKDAHSQHHPEQRRFLAAQRLSEIEQRQGQFSAIQGNLIQPYSRLANEGRIELLTTSATHAF